MKNKDFLKILNQSFKIGLQTSERSNQKLYPLHGGIAQDFQKSLGVQYSLFSLGFNEGKEKKIEGRYINKAVDIVIEHKGKIIAGIAVKFVMSNYAQNSNNYFENMLGETANIRTKGIPYFQILILPSILPYYKKEGDLPSFEKISDHHLSKYQILSKDDSKAFFHTPDKTLLCLLQLPTVDTQVIKTKKAYQAYCLEKEITHFEPIKNNFDSGVIINDYETFVKKVSHCIKGL